MDIDDKKIAERCSEALRQKGVMRKTFAETIGKSRATVSDYLNGNLKIPTATIVVISKLTGKSIDELITGRVQEISKIEDCVREEMTRYGLNEEDYEIILLIKKLSPGKKELAKIVLKDMAKPD
ncbi:helix-turn-helix domain-containing protein [Desulfuromonas acetoxidans]|uniref:helix-turn-helix domain-containing protein n=1 Tax=Desulfuromonas acetoxidans TaxID=891 RepID=UPI002930EB35|nr:helix-turn-helix domain-containing protein [Desulfuromonas acetoxidans]